MVKSPAPIKMAKIAIRIPHIFSQKRKNKNTTQNIMTMPIVVPTTMVIITSSTTITIMMLWLSFVVQSGVEGK